MANYIEIEDQSEDKVKHYLLNLDMIAFIDAATIEQPFSDGLEKGFNAPIIIRTPFVTIKLPCIGKTEEEALEEQKNLYNKLYNCILYSKSNKERKIIIKALGEGLRKTN